MDEIIYILRKQMAILVEEHGHNMPPDASKEKERIENQIKALSNEFLRV